MWVLYGEIELCVSEAHSLKDKRMIVQSIKDIMKRQFDVIVRESERQDDEQYIVLSAVSIADKKEYLHTLWEKITVYIENRYAVRITHDAVSVVQGEV